MESASRRVKLDHPTRSTSSTGLPSSPGCEKVLQVTAEQTSSALEKEQALPRWAVTLRALRHRNFQLFFSGQLISLVGTWMQSVAQAWLVYRLTGSALLLGSVGFASQFPVFLDRKSTRLNSSHLV